MTADLVNNATSYLIQWTPTVITTLTAVGIFIGRNWIQSRIERSVQHRYDAQIEAIRADLRKSEEGFKSDLRVKESEIATLRDGALSGRMQRQALLDKRRLEAVERIWTSVLALGAGKNLTSLMSVLKFDALVQRTPHDPKLRNFFETMNASQPPDVETAKAQIAADAEQLFLTPLSWAYFSAYRMIISSARFRVRLLALGIENAGEVLSVEACRSILKSALPDYATYIDNTDPSAYHYLLDIIEQRLLFQLKDMLEGGAIDSANVAQAAKIMDEVKKFQTTTEEATAAMNYRGSIPSG